MTNHHFTASLSKRSFPLDNNYIINNDTLLHTQNQVKNIHNILTEKRITI